MLEEGEVNENAHREMLNVILASLTHAQLEVVFRSIGLKLRNGQISPIIGAKTAALVTAVMSTRHREAVCTSPQMNYDESSDESAPPPPRFNNLVSDGRNLHRGQNAFNVGASHGPVDSLMKDGDEETGRLTPVNFSSGQSNAQGNSSGSEGKNTVTPNTSLSGGSQIQKKQQSSNFKQSGLLIDFDELPKHTSKPVSAAPTASNIPSNVQNSSAAQRDPAPPHQSSQAFGLAASRHAQTNTSPPVNNRHSTPTQPQHAPQAAAPPRSCHGTSTVEAFQRYSNYNTTRPAPISARLPSQAPAQIRPRVPAPTPQASDRTHKLAPYETDNVAAPAFNAFLPALMNPTPAPAPGPKEQTRSGGTFRPVHALPSKATNTTSTPAASTKPLGQLHIGNPTPTPAPIATTKPATQRPHDTNHTPAPAENRDRFRRPATNRPRVKQTFLHTYPSNSSSFRSSSDDKDGDGEGDEDGYEDVYGPPPRRRKVASSFGHLRAGKKQKVGDGRGGADTYEGQGAEDGKADANQDLWAHRNTTNARCDSDSDADMEGVMDDGRACGPGPATPASAPPKEAPRRDSVMGGMGMLQGAGTDRDGMTGMNATNGHVTNAMSTMTNTPNTSANADTAHGMVHQATPAGLGAVNTAGGSTGSLDGVPSGGLNASPSATPNPSPNPSNAAAMAQMQAQLEHMMAQIQLLSAGRG